MWFIAVSQTIFATFRLVVVKGQFWLSRREKPEGNSDVAVKLGNLLDNAHVAGTTGTVDATSTVGTAKQPQSVFIIWIEFFLSSVEYQGSWPMFDMAGCCIELFLLILFEAKKNGQQKIKIVMTNIRHWVNNFQCAV